MTEGELDFVVRIWRIRERIKTKASKKIKIKKRQIWASHVDKSHAYTRTSHAEDLEVINHILSK